MTYQIIKACADDKLEDGTVVYHDEYVVINSPIDHSSATLPEIDNATVMFRGTFTQCMTYIGARVTGRGPETAERFALGVYR